MIDVEVVAETEQVLPFAKGGVWCGGCPRHMMTPGRINSTCAQVYPVGGLGERRLCPRGRNVLSRNRFTDPLAEDSHHPHDAHGLPRNLVLYLTTEAW